MEQDLNRIKLVLVEKKDWEMAGTRTRCIRMYGVKMGQ